MKGLISLLLALMLASFEVYAISVASDYLANDTLELLEGASKIYGIRLQNPTNNEVGIKLDYDKTFMKVINYNEVYTLRPKETGYGISFNVTAAKKPGTYEVGYTVGEVEPSGGGGLPIRLRISRSFKLRVIEDPNKTDISYSNKTRISYSGLAYAAVLLTIGLVLVRKIMLKIMPKKQERKRKVNK